MNLIERIVERFNRIKGVKELVIIGDNNVITTPEVATPPKNLQIKGKNNTVVIEHIPLQKQLQLRLEKQRKGIK